MSTHYTTPGENDRAQRRLEAIRAQFFTPEQDSAAQRGEGGGMRETVVVTEEGCDNSWTYRRCEEDDEQFELVCEDGSTKGTRSHFEDVLLDNIARRDDAIATLSAGFVAHDCRDGKLVAIPWALCSACVSVTECRQYTARQLCNTLATLRAQLAGVREGVGKIIAHTGRLPNASPDLLNGLLDSVERNARDVLAALDGAA